MKIDRLYTLSQFIFYIQYLDFQVNEKLRLITFYNNFLKRYITEEIVLKNFEVEHVGTCEDDFAYNIGEYTIEWNGSFMINYKDIETLHDLAEYTGGTLKLKNLAL